MNSSILIKILVFVALIVTCAVAVGRTRDSERPVTIEHFKEVVKPFTDVERKKVNKEPLRYPQYTDIDGKRVPINGKEPGTVDARGNVVYKGAEHAYLDCSSFASPVLHRLFNSDFRAFDQAVQQGWGDEIAAHYGLTSSYTGSLADFLTNYKRGSLSLGVYFFDIRNNAGKTKAAGGLGHVGFLLVEKSGVRQIATQVHMTGMKTVSGCEEGGLAYDNNFYGFITGSLYGNTESRRMDSTITLYLIVVK